MHPLCHQQSMLREIHASSSRTVYARSLLYLPGRP